LVPFSVCGILETWRHGHGDIDKWKHRNMETWRHGDMETWRHKHETWEHGEMETWRHRHGDMNMETWTWRHGHEDMDMETSNGKRKLRCAKRKFVVNPFVDEKTNGSCPFANGLYRLNGLNGLADLCSYVKKQTIFGWSSCTHVGLCASSSLV
jgi:hypothetical protein